MNYDKALCSTRYTEANSREWLSLLFFIFFYLHILISSNGLKLLVKFQAMGVKVAKNG